MVMQCFNDMHSLSMSTFILTVAEVVCALAVLAAGQNTCFFERFQH